MDGTSVMNLEQQQQNRSRSGLGLGGRLVRAVLGVELLVLLALAQVMFAGYRLGVGNQSIQIPFLKHWIDPGLYANDSMVKQTLADYPSFFFRLLAVVVGRVDLYSAYFWLHVATSAAVLWAAYELGKAIFKDRASGVVLALLMLAGHHRALAGDELYSLGFTHTWAVFPLALLALVLFYREWHWAAFALVGVIFNLHALTAGYLLVMFLAWAVVDYRPKMWWLRLGLMVGLFALIALPTVREMLAHPQQFGKEWLERTRIRSGDHSFPSTWWTTGSSDLPRFVLLMGLVAVSLSFAAPGRNQRKSLLLAAGVGVLFLVGWVFSDIWPLATVVRAQLFRSSRLLVVLMLAHIAHGIVSGLRMGNFGAIWRGRAARGDWRGSSDEPFPAQSEPRISMRDSDAGGVAGLRWLEVLLAVATFVCLAVPGLMAVAPWVLVGALIVALINGRLGSWQAVAASLALLLTVIAWRTIDFDIPGIDGVLSFKPLARSWNDGGRWLWLGVGLAAVVAVLWSARVGTRVRLCAAVAVLFICALVGLHGNRALAAVRVADDPWIAVQMWAARNTPKDAVFLTPPQQGGFRIYSDRSVVCEWRDGTQLYFSAKFAKDWWDKLTALRPVLYDSKGTKELMHGKTLESMSDREIVQLAKAYGASYVVLPASDAREMPAVFRNKGGPWAIYEPRILDAQDAFIEYVCKPNIEKYRKSDVRLELSDASGRAITSGDYEIRQTKQAFGFGCSLPFFADPAGDSGQDSFEPPVVTAKQLQLFKEVFNYSVIPFSAKWQRIEPNEGERHYEELDKYVDWCSKNGVTIEFHYLSGFQPYWARRLGSAGLRQAWMRHCRETVERYHDKIKYWQVVNDALLADYAAEVFKEIHAKYPDLKLGISNCSQFYAGGGFESVGGSSALMRGSSELGELQAEGAKVDFFSSHGHKPMGCWPDMRQVYECLDAWAKYGVKVHVSEATLDIGLHFVSPVREEPRWTPELAADFFERYYTVLFSHPAMEAINYWDLSASIERAVFSGPAIGGTGQAGLLDPLKNDAPRPIYNRLKELIRVKWMTRLSGPVPSDGGGAVTFRGFHGDYEVSVRTASGKVLRGTFSVKPAEGVNEVKLKLVEESGSVAKGG